MTFDFSRPSIGSTGSFKKNDSEIVVEKRISLSEDEVPDSLKIFFPRSYRRRCQEKGGRRGKCKLIVLCTNVPARPIQAMLQRHRRDLGHLLVDYPVPLRDRPALVLKAVNWPKAFFVRGLRLVAEGEDPRAKCLSLLAEHRVPKGTESKHFNTVAFFDHCVALWNKERKQKARRSAG